MPGIPVPTDPRTPVQAVRDQLQAARAQLVHGCPSRSDRRVLGDRIFGLETRLRALENATAVCE